MLDLVLLQPPDAVSSNPKMYFPLSLCYLAAVVEKAGYTVEVLDFRDSVKELPEARFYGFSATTPQINMAKAIASKVSGKTIVGGAHPSLLPQDCVGSFDYVVRGEGEEVIVGILKGKIKEGVINAPRIYNLDSVPFPAWHKIAEPFSDTLFSGERYGKGQVAGTLIGSRGCPYLCSFCANLFRNPVIYRSVDNIVNELKYLISHYGLFYFRFEDDNFTLHPEFYELCHRLSSLGIHFKCHTKSSLLTEERAEWLKWAGCEECGLGVESADNEVLRLNKKKETIAQHGGAVKILKKTGIRVKVYLMAGLPGETDNSVKVTKEFMRMFKPDKWTLSTFTPYPGSEIFNEPEKFNMTIINSDWSNWWNFIPNKGFNHILEGQTPEEMWNRYKEFYNFLKEETWRA